jgi:alpha-1,2-mannosyltransferase
MFQVRPRLGVFLGTGLVLLYGPLTINLFWAQAQIPIFLLLILALRWFHQREDWACGGALAVAGLIKTYPLLVLGYFILLRRWRIAASALIVIASAALFSIMLFGIDINTQFMHQLQHYDIQAEVTESISIPVVILRLFWLLVGGRPFPTVLRLAVIATIWVIMSGLFLLTVWATISAHRNGCEEAVYGLWVAAAVLLSPVSWIHHMVLMLIPLGELLDPRANPMAVKIGMYGYALAEIGLGLFWYRELAHPSSSFSLALYPAVFLASLLVTFVSTYVNAIYPVRWPIEGTVR